MTENNTSTTFDASGITPFSIDPITQTIYFLLAKCNNASRVGIWTDFGGHKKEDDADHVHTAAREFSEESLCCLQPHKTSPDMNTKTYTQEILSRLIKQDYAFCVEQDTTNPDGKLNRRSYFLMNFHWQSEAPNNFRTKKSSLNGIVTAGNAFRTLVAHPAVKDGSIDSAWNEKSEVRWFSLDFLIQCLSTNSAFRGVRISKVFAGALVIMVNKLYQISHRHS